MLVDPYRFAAVGPTIYGLNPTDKHADITLSNSNFTATKSDGSVAWRTARSVTSHTFGKFYYEWVGNEFSSSFIAAGFATAAASLATYPGSETTSLGLVTDGSVFRAGSSTAVHGGFGENEIICMAIDLDNGMFWCRRLGGNWNNSGTANPATNTGGLALNAGMTTGSPAIHAAVGVQSPPTDQLTVNFGASAFGYAMPSGFTAWG